MAAIAPATTPRSYEDIQTSSNWVTEEKQDILSINLHGFKKEQLRVQIIKPGSLKVSGERPLEETKWGRFQKEFRIPKDANVTEINAKFVDGILYITVPKTKTRVPPQDEATTPTQQSPAGEINGSRKDSKNNQQQVAGGDSGGTEKTDEGSIKAPNGKGGMIGSVLRTLKKPPRAVVKVAVAATVIVVVVALGVYAAYKLKSTTVGGDED